MLHMFAACFGSRSTHAKVRCRDRVHEDHGRQGPYERKVSTSGTHSRKRSNVGREPDQETLVLESKNSRSHIRNPNEDPMFPNQVPILQYRIMSGARCRITSPSALNKALAAPSPNSIPPPFPPPPPHPESPKFSKPDSPRLRP